MHAETARCRIASACPNRLEERKTKNRQKKSRERMGIRKQGKGIKKTDERQQRFDPQQNAKGTSFATAEIWEINIQPQHQNIKQNFLVCAQAAAQAFSSSDRDGVTNQLHCFTILPRLWRWMIPSLLPSLLFYRRPPLVPRTLTFNTRPLLSLASPPCLCLISTTHTNTRDARPPTHPSHEFSSIPLPFPLAKILPPSSPPIFALRHLG